MKRALLITAVLSAIATSEAPPLRASEALDVPPPPAQRSIRVRGQTPAIELGKPVYFYDGSKPIGVGDLVLTESNPPSFTVYVPEESADALLTAERLSFAPVAP